MMLRRRDSLEAKRALSFFKILIRHPLFKGVCGGECHSRGQEDFVPRIFRNSREKN